jgi:hypothetical protein
MLSSSFSRLIKISLVFLAILTLGLVACGDGSGDSDNESSDSTITYYAVTTLSDSGPGSLRAAIGSVNGAPSTQYSGITFSVSGVITLAGDLPPITNKVLINGATAPGYFNDNTTSPPVVAVNFNNVGTGFDFEKGSEGSGIWGLSIYGSTSNAISLTASRISVLSNYIGVNLVDEVVGNAGSSIYIATASTADIIDLDNLSAGNRVDGILEILRARRTQNFQSKFSSARIFLTSSRSSCNTCNPSSCPPDICSGYGTPVCCPSGTGSTTCCATGGGR